MYAGNDTDAQSSCTKVGRQLTTPCSATKIRTRSQHLRKMNFSRASSAGPAGKLGKETEVLTTLVEEHEAIVSRRLWPQECSLWDARAGKFKSAQGGPRVVVGGRSKTRRGGAGWGGESGR